MRIFNGLSRGYFFITIVIVFTLVGVSNILCRTEVFQPTQPEANDAYVWQVLPTINQGTAPDLVVGYYMGFYTSFIEFTRLDDFSGVIVENATLELYCHGKHGVEDRDLYCYRVIEAWSEDDVTFWNKPGHDEPHVVFTDCPVNQWLSIDVTEIVEVWIDETYENHGFCLKSQTGPTSYSIFYSADYTESDYRPFLTLEYHYSSIETKSLGGIKSLFQ